MHVVAAVTVPLPESRSPLQVAVARRVVAMVVSSLAVEIGLGIGTASRHPDGPIASPFGPVRSSPVRAGSVETPATDAVDGGPYQSPGPSGRLAHIPAAAPPGWLGHGPQ